MSKNFKKKKGVLGGSELFYDSLPLILLVFQLKDTASPTLLRV